MPDTNTGAHPEALSVDFFQAMMAEGEERSQKLQQVEEGLRAEMEDLAIRVRDLVLSQPVHDLLGYLWNCLLLQSIGRTDHDPAALQFAMEYVHAVLSCFDTDAGNPALDEGVVAEVLAIAEKLRHVCLLYCMASSNSNEGAFGDKTGHVEMQAKSTWMIIRGHRYQVLEEEFFLFVLAPHDDAFRRAYGISSDAVAAGIQSITDSMRAGLGRAIALIGEQKDLAFERAEKEGIALKDAIQKMKQETSDGITAVQESILDLFRGGICNLSRHTDLPEPLLEDLAYRRGENNEFYAPGPFSGTPLHTLPARIKPLIQLDDGFYATDPQFIRDAAYRALQRGLLERLPDYREEWKRKQTTLTEDAFPRIFARQLDGATVLKEVYYRDINHGNWVENDTLILLGDVMLQIEAKGGVAAMDSPATNFNRHVRAIQDLVVKAYRQTKRFLDYLNSAPEVPLYELRDGQHVEVHRLRLSNYRMIFPIGLTVENFSPFSTMCKELPEVQPLLGKHPFVSMSIDDLFVLQRFLPTTGEIFHYLEVRQAVAGIKNGNLFDELDHLGAYIEKNRFDLTILDQFTEGAHMVSLDAFSGVVDKYFEGDDWQQSSPPSQDYPDELKSVLGALDRTRSGNWLFADSLLRNLGSTARSNLARALRNLLDSLRDNPWRWFILDGEFPILLWLHRDYLAVDQPTIEYKAEVGALAAGTKEIQVIRLSVGFPDNIISAHAMMVKSPPIIRADYHKLLAEAESSKIRTARMAATQAPDFTEAAGKKLKPNQRCWCGSGKKFKKCHGSGR